MENKKNRAIGKSKCVRERGPNWREKTSKARKYRLILEDIRIKEIVEK